MPIPPAPLPEKERTVPPPLDAATPPPASDALRANLQATAVERVEIAPEHQPLREVVREYAGILQSLDRLLLELNHPYRNWRLILPELRGFVLKYLSRFIAPPQAPACFELFAEIFFRALHEAGKEALEYSALEGLSAYLEKVAASIPPERFPHFTPVFDRIFARLAELPERRLLLLAQSHHPVKRSLLLLMERAPAGVRPLDPGPIRELALRSLDAAYRYWLAQPDPSDFATLEADAFREIDHATLQRHAAELEVIRALPPDTAMLQRMVTLPSFLDVVRAYRRAADQLGRQGGSLSEDDERLMESRKLRFMFHILETSGLALIHEETLKEVNRSLVHLVRLKQEHEALESFLLRAFAFLKAHVVHYPHTALQCIEALGMEVLKRNNGRLMEAFLAQAVRFGFQYSEVRGVGVDWQPLGNPAHLFNLRAWLNLVAWHPWWCSTLLSALVINLKLGGTCIRDTDLFQKDITRLLNSTIGPVYNLFKQFARQLPVYFNEIGAEGELRDVSTELDEITRRRDRLVHFLRKQCHVESTNLTVTLIRAILAYWRSGDKRILAALLPDVVLETVADQGPLFDGVHALAARLYATQGFRDEDDLLHWPLEPTETWIEAQQDIPPLERRRLYLLIRLFRLLHHKYHLGHEGLQAPLEQAVRDGIPHIAPLLPLLADPATPQDELLHALLDALESLKQEILSPQVHPAREEIYQKRHIAVDIPSVYGSYQERKFDALSLSFRLETLANVHLESLLEKIPDDFITRATFFRVAKYLRFFLRALTLDGIASRKLHNYLEILERFLELNQFSFHQYVDIFRGFSEGVRDVIYTYYTSHHRNNLAVIVEQFPREALLPRFAALVDDDPTATLERVSETLMRDLIAETFGLQAFDAFIARILRILDHQEGRLSPRGLDQLMTYDPAKLFCTLHTPNKRCRNLIHLGNKGFNLVELAEQGIPVPPGSILTTEYFRCRQVVRHYPPAWKDFSEQLRQEIAAMERATEHTFGSTERPLLLSVRSGALISMPGMMQTIHNVGINLKIVEGMTARSGNAFFAWDNYRRFIQSWCMTWRAERSHFNELMRRAKERHGVRFKREFTADHMRELALSYQDLANQLEIPIPDDPWEQLLGSIQQVVNSWNAAKAIEYRRILDISNDWGTAVVLQSMVFGNLHHSSGTGVLFTAHPHRKLNRVVLWGDYTTGNQGEDIVGGLVATLPISLEQCQYDGRDPDSCLERRFPRIFQRMLAIARHLIYELRWNPQEIEFTFDGPEAENLFLLQTRAMVTTENEKGTLYTFKSSPKLSLGRLARGIGVSGGALCGVAVFRMEHIQQLREEQPGTPLILIRYDTVPDDIREIAACDGLLTARGGQTSHAAIVAARLKKTCVVGCETLRVREKSDECDINGTVIRLGDPIAIDGHLGAILNGWHEIETTIFR